MKQDTNFRQNYKMIRGGTRSEALARHYIDINEPFAEAVSIIVERVEGASLDSEGDWDDVHLSRETSEHDPPRIERMLKQSHRVSLEPMDKPLTAIKAFSLARGPR